VQELSLVEGMLIRCQHGDARVVEVSDTRVKLGLSRGRYRWVRLEDVRVEQILEAPQPKREVNKQVYAAVADALEGNLIISKELFAWMIASATVPDLDGLSVAVIGSGPLEQTAVGGLLSSIGIECKDPSEETGILIVGRGDCSDTQLRTLLTMRAGRTLRVYSQEMALTWLISGSDPFSIKNPERIRVLGGDHPTLRHLELVLAFAWPTTRVLPSHTTLEGFPAEPIGYLKREGYEVGRHGAPESRRRQILDYCYGRGVVPYDYSDEYRAEWGAAGTSTRLYKIAESIASFCRNRKRQSNPSRDAIDDWERDLDWLYETYYRGRYQFAWPGTSVW
jgi:hypothetical protein